MRPAVGLANVPSVSVQVSVVSPPAIRPLINAPSVLEIETTGRPERSPAGSVPTTVPANLPAELLYIITAAAPAFIALTAFVLNVHVPRRIRTALPVKLPAVSAEHASFVVVVVPVRAIGRLPEIGGFAAPVIV